MKIAMIMRPNRIQKTEKMRAAIDFGTLSPYLKQEEAVINLVIVLYELAKSSHLYLQSSPISQLRQKEPCVKLKFRT